MKSKEEKVNRIINNLMQKTALKAKFKEVTLSQRMKQLRTPGVSIAVIKDYKIDWAEGFGVKEYGKNNSITEETLFQAGSLSKPIFALAVMRLVQAGKLDLDEDVNNYLTTFKIPKNGNWQPKVTLRQLLIHTAGLTVGGFYGYFPSEDLPNGNQMFKGEFPANHNPISVNLVPGTQFRYSGGGYVVAQQLLCDVLQKPLPEIMQELVLEPLGMENSTYQQPLPVELHSKAAKAHKARGDKIGENWHAYPEMSAAGLWTTPTDLAKAGIELMLAYKGESERFLSQELIKMMLECHIEHQAIGFMLQGKDNNERFCHGGWNEGFVAHMSFYKEYGLGAVVMLNSNEGYDILLEVERAIAKEYNWSGYFEESNILADVSTEILATYDGNYKTESGLKIQVTTDENHILLKVADQNGIEFFPKSETEFFAEVVNGEIRFEKDEDGELKLILIQEGNEIIAIKG